MPFPGLGKGIFPAHAFLMGPDRLHEVLADGEQRVQGRQRVLEDHGDLGPAQFEEFTGVHAHDIAAKVENFSSGYRSRRSQEAEDGEAQR